MMIYKVGEFTLSADLQRYSKPIKNSNLFEIGFCVVEHVPPAFGSINFRPQVIDTTKPYDIVDYDLKSKLSGKLAIQRTVESESAEVSEEVSWIAIKIDVPNGDLDALIVSVAKESGVEINEQSLAQTRERLLTKRSTPKQASPKTVAALIRNTSALKAAHYYKIRLELLAEFTDMDVDLAEWIVFSDRAKGFHYVEDDGWQPIGMTMLYPLTQEELDTLVDKGYLVKKGDTYINTDKAKQALRETYL